MPGQNDLSRVDTMGQSSDSPTASANELSSTVAQLRALVERMDAELQRITRLRIQDDEAHVIPSLQAFMWLHELAVLVDAFEDALELQPSSAAVDPHAGRTTD